MNLDQILTLIGAGYTKAEIEAMTAPANDSKPESKAKEDTKPETKPAEDTKPVKSDDSTLEAMKTLTANVAALAETVKAIQNTNAARAKADTTETDGADSVIRDFFGVKAKR